MALVNILIPAIFGFMIVSPRKFFNKVDEVILEEETYTSEFPCAIGIMPANELILDRDMKRIENFNKMIAAAKSPEVKRIWELKKSEYERKMRWVRLTEHAHASERTPR